MNNKGIHFAKVGDPSNRHSGPQRVDVFDVASFYSQEYTGEAAEELVKFQLLVEEYDAWKREYFMGKANNTPVEDLPKKIIALMSNKGEPDRAEKKPPRKRNTKKSSQGGAEVGAGVSDSAES